VSYGKRVRPGLFALSTDAPLADAHHETFAIRFHWPCFYFRSSDAIFILPFTQESILEDLSKIQRIEARQCIRSHKL
jgi:hypothetical protein